MSVGIVTGLYCGAFSGQANEIIAVSGEIVHRNRPGFGHPRVWIRVAPGAGSPIKSVPILPLVDSARMESCSLSQQLC